MTQEKVVQPIDAPDARNGADVSRPTLRTASRAKFRPLLWTVASLVSALTIWALLSRYMFSPLLLPSPWAVAKEAGTMIRSGELASNTASTMERLILGYVLGVVAGTLAGSCAGRIKIFRGLVLPLVNLIRPLSPVALIPLFIIWFGIGQFSKVLLVSYTSFVTLFFCALTGVAATPMIRERAALSLGAGRMELAWSVVLPSSVPYILTGLRLAVSNAYMSVVAAELFAATSGLGYLIMSSRLNLLTTRMFVALASLGILGLISDFLVRKLIARFGRRFLTDEVANVV